MMHDATLKTWLRRGGLGALFAAAMTIGACKSGESNGDSKPAGSAQADKEASGPCANYADKLCEEAGEKSGTCQSLKTATGIMAPEACEAGLANIDMSLKKLAEKTKACDELIKKLCDAVGPKTESCKMVTKQTKKFPPERCEKMLQQTDKIVADLKKREAMNKPLDEKMQAKIATGDAPAFGPEDAKVTIVEFSDFECPFCSRAANVVDQIKEEYGDKVRFVFRQFPLSMHPNAQEAAEASLAAHAQGKFWEYHDQLFANQKQLDADSLKEHAQETGLDVGQFETALEEDEYKEQVKEDMALGKKVNVRGTPTVFVNGTRVSNPTDFSTVKSLIDKELKKS